MASTIPCHKTNRTWTCDPLEEGNATHDWKNVLLMDSNTHIVQKDNTNVVLAEPSQ